MVIVAYALGSAAGWPEDVLYQLASVGQNFPHENALLSDWFSAWFPASGVNNAHSAWYAIKVDMD